jgi:6-phosphogluconolactonase (cycloisomerase 2 family)
MIEKPRLTVNEPVARLFIGTYTRKTAAEGTYTCQWDPRSGRFSSLALAARADNPSFVVIRTAVSCWCRISAAIASTA